MDYNQKANLDIDDDPFALLESGQDDHLDKELSLSLSPSAAKRITELAKLEGMEQAILRLTVLGGGCSGYQYHFDLINKIKDDDYQTSLNDAILVTDYESLNLISGSQLDYIDDLVGAYFTVTNPKARSSCGCGTSFSL